MNRRELSDPIAAIEKWIGELREAAALTDKEKLDSALEAVRNALEEFSVAEEELRQQNDQLLAVTQAEQTMRGRYQELFDLAPDGYVVTDTRGVIGEANKAAAALLNLSEVRLAGKPLASFVAPDDRQAFRVRLTALARSPSTETFEVHLQPLMQAPLAAMVHVAPSPARDGQPATLRWAIHDVTDRERAQEELRSSQATLASVVGTAMDAIVCMDKDQRIVVFNRAAERIFHCAAQEALGQPVEKFIPERFREKHAERVRCFREGLQRSPTSGGVPLQTVGLRADGEEFPMEASMSATMVGGQWLCTIILRDITERLRAERELAESRQLLEGMADSSPDILFVFDLVQRRDVYASKSLARVLGYTPEQVQALGDKVMGALLHPDDLAGIEARLEQMARLKAGEVYESELRIKHTSGEWRWLRQRQVALARGADGLVTRTAGVAWDITEEKRAAEALRQSEERFRLLAENSRDMIFRLRLKPALAYEYVSPAARTVTGYSPEEFYGDSQLGLKFAHPEGGRELVEAARRGELSGRVVHRIIRKDGSVRWIEADVVPVFDAAAELVAVNGAVRDVTERVQVGGVLEAERRRLQAILENTHTHLAYLDRDFNFLAVNSAYAQGSGHTLEELIGKNHFHLFPNDENRAIFQRVRDTGEPVEFRDKPFISSNQPGRGVTYWDWTLSPVKDGAEVQGLVLSLVETTERVRSAETLNQQATAMTAAANGIVITDREGRILWVNPAFTRVTGYAPEEVLGHNPRILKSGQHDRQFYAGLWNAILAGKVWHGDIVNRRKDGSLYYEEQTVTPVKNAMGEVSQFIAIKQDVTARKMAEQEAARLLAESNQERARLEAVLETSPVGIFMADATGKVVLANAEAQRLIGFPAEPDAVLVNRRSDGTIYKPDDLPLMRALRTGERVFLEEIVFETPDGQTGKNLVTATPIYSSDGKITGAIAIVQDMGPLEEAERRRNEFLGMVSHELRTPLTAIKGAAATALSSQTADYAETVQLFRIIDQQADKLRDLVNNLLDLTRIEAGTLSINAMPTDLAAVVQEATTTFARADASHEVQVRLADALPRVHADGRRVAQVLTNLLSNAAKFSPPSLPIVLEAEYDASYVTVHVTDRGRGIPPDKMSSLFKKFSQLHEDSGRALAGTGLGLAICKGIVEAHGGRIWAESGGEGQGATFSFTLPVTVGTLLVAPDTARRTGHLGRVSRTFEKTRILSVDDDPQTLRYIRRTLEEAGYQTFVTADPAQCAKLVQEQEPDLVLLDLVLPGTSGFEVLQGIREFSGVPVIFLTGTDQGDNAVRALKLGADDYITKPFSPSELLARIEVVLRRRLMPHVVEVRPPFTLGDLTINFAERRVLKMGQPVSLSATEYKLLYQLAVHAGQVMTHDQLLEQVWGSEYKGEAELLRSMMRNLRRSLGDDARQPRYILTEPQVGYRMASP